MKNHRHKFFDSDRNVEDEMRVVRPSHENVIIFVRACETLVLLFTLYQGWSS
jgi:hypothetical protein